MSHSIWTEMLGTAIAVVLVGAVLAFGGPVGAGSNPSTVATTYPCSHMGGGVWEERWNNSSGAGPTHVWVPQPGHYWASYNNTTGAAADPGWGTSGSGTPESGPGRTVVNMTNDPAAAESMMEYMCMGSGSTLPWHYDFAAQIFVRDP